ncbi:MAG: hypothetical protein LBP61_10355 [Desulfovibrio sp.]|jgi:lipopolysaccharide biosynthesis glycosyltransferase|nr:hypothetical protein [Desulfovibrio sp.]
MIHVALCFSDSSGTYYKHALVTALSVFDNTKSEICLHIIHDETLTPAAGKAFTDLCAGWGHRLVLHPAEEIPKAVADNVPDSFGKGALYRLMIPRLIQEDRILYLDCDVVCACDPEEIYRRDLSGKYLGAVPIAEKQGLRVSRKYGLASPIYVNSGVLLLDLEKIRREIPDFLERLSAIVRDREIRIADQEAINIFFDGKANAFALLPEFCNFRIDPEDHAVLPLAAYQGKVLHFAGEKPWRVFTPPALYYWKYYAALFPGENVLERMVNLEPYEYAPLFSFLLRHERLRRWVNRLREAERDGLASVIRARLFPRSGKQRKP